MTLASTTTTPTPTSLQGRNSSPGDCDCCCCTRPISCLMIFSAIFSLSILAFIIPWLQLINFDRIVLEDFPEGGISTNNFNNTNVSDAYAGYIVWSTDLGKNAYVSFCTRTPNVSCALPPSSDNRVWCFFGPSLTHDGCDARDSELESRFFATCPGKMRNVSTEIALCAFALITVLIGFFTPCITATWWRPQYEKFLTGEMPGYQIGMSKNDHSSPGYNFFLPWFSYLYLGAFSITALCCIILMGTEQSLSKCGGLSGEVFVSNYSGARTQAFWILMLYVLYVLVFFCVLCCWQRRWKREYDAWIKTMEETWASASMACGEAPPPTQQQQESLDTAQIPCENPPMIPVTTHPLVPEAEDGQQQ